MGNSNCDDCGHDKSMCECPKQTTEYLNDLQVGGDHYAGSYQHWDWAADVGLGYFESAATKYIFRWYKKNGIEDLDKAKSYLIKARQLWGESRWINDCTHVSTFAPIRNESDIHFMKFVKEAKVPLVEHQLCYKIACWKTGENLQVIIGEITTHLEAVRAAMMPVVGIAPLKPLEAAQQAQTMPNQPYDGVAMQAFGPCPCGCGHARAKGQYFASATCSCPGHVLYKTGDVDAPKSITDRNGEVVLQMCRICGKAEGELS